MNIFIAPTFQIEEML